MEKAKPILFVTLDENLSPQEHDLIQANLERHCQGYIVLAALGKQQSAKVLSARKMKRRDYQQVVNAAKKILSNG